MCGDGCNDCGALKTAHAGKQYFNTQEKYKIYETKK